MSMMKFHRRKRRVEVDPRTLLLAPLNDIWNMDPSEIKDEANKKLAYVHLVCRLDPEAPFYNSDPGEVEYLAKKEIFGSLDFQFTPEDQQLVNDACLAYTKANEIIEERLYHDLCDKIDEVRKKIAITKVEIVTNVDKGKKTFTTNGQIITKLIADLDNLIEIKDSLWNKVRNARQGEQKVKGQREPSFLEKKFMEGRYGKRSYEDSVDSEESTQEATGKQGDDGIQDTEYEPVRETQGAEESRKENKSTSKGKRTTKALPAAENGSFWPRRDSTGSGGEA